MGQRPTYDLEGGGHTYVRPAMEVKVALKHSFKAEVAVFDLGVFNNNPS